MGFSDLERANGRQELNVDRIHKILVAKHKYLFPPTLEIAANLSRILVRFIFRSEVVKLFCYYLLQQSRKIPCSCWWS